MDVGGSLQRLLARWAESLGAKDGRGSAEPLGQGLAERYGPPSCALCGRRLLPGEPLGRFAIDGDVVVVCPVCEPDALMGGYLRVRPEGRPERWSTAGGQVTRVDRRSATEAAPPVSDETPPGSDEAPSVTEGALPPLVDNAASDETAAGRHRGTRLKSAA